MLLFLFHYSSFAAMQFSVLQFDFKSKGQVVSGTSSSGTTMILQTLLKKKKQVKHFPVPLTPLYVFMSSSQTVISC